MDGGNGNDPHVGCGFSVSFFGYDGGPQHATISVTPWAPTAGGHPMTFGPVNWDVGTRSSGNQLDANYQVSASDVSEIFGGVAPSAQGFHARIEVEVTGSQGSDDKFKMVWISQCASTPLTPAATGSSGATSTSPSGSGTAAPAVSSSAAGGLAASSGNKPAPVDTPPGVLGASTLSGFTSPLARQGGVAGDTPPAESPSGGLAFTGVEIALMVLAGLALIGTGVFAVTAARRRRVMAA